MRTGRIELPSSEWRSDIEPINHVRVLSAFAEDSDFAKEWWEVDGIEPLAPQGPRLQRGDGASLSLLALPA